MIMKRVGVITMHRVMNVGSVLQAYALCEKLSHLGMDVEIIDYQYPNDYHIEKKSTLLKQVRRLLLLPQRIKYYVLYKKTVQQQRFAEFYERRMRFSKYFPSREALRLEPPTYDIYLTGSDQVWNHKCMKGDGTFFFDFVESASKASYAASFSSHNIPENLRENYASYLKTYKYIGVREEEAVQLVGSLTNKDAVTVCDPTLLLTRDDYMKIAADSKLSPSREPYILVYALSYAYNPYPQIEKVANYVKQKLGYKVVYLCANTVDHYHLGRSITSAGPAEFIDLFLNAKFVVTSSFHGTIFAVNFEVPFISIVPDDTKEDSRIMSILKILGLTSRAICVKQDLPSEISLDMNFAEVRAKLASYRFDSENFLKRIVEL